MDQNPCGLHVESRDTRFNRQSFIDHCVTANYSTLSLMDDFGLSMDMTDALPQAYIVHRVYEKVQPGPPVIGPWQGAPEINDPVVIKQSAINYLTSRSEEWNNSDPRAKKVYLNINCEPGFTRQLCDWYIAMLDYAYEKKIRLVIGNWGSGRLKEGQGADPNWWLTDGAALLKKLDTYKDSNLFVLGFHEYTTFYAWAVSDGLAPERPEGWKFENAPNPVDFTKPQWHIGRLYGVVAACKSFSPPIDPPKIIVTEGLLDDMQDIQNRMTVSLTVGRRTARGWWSLEPQFRQWYPTRDAGEVYAGMNQWAWEAVYAPLGCVIGMNNFTWCDASGKDWEDFRVDNSIGYRKSMEKYRPMVVQPVFFKNPDWAHLRQLIGGPDNVNLREQPNIAAKSLGVLSVGTEVQYFPASRTTDGWVYVEKGSTSNGGWIKSDIANLIDPPLPVSVPAPAPVINWRTQFTDIELKIINAAVTYSKDTYPDPGSNLKLIISKLVTFLGV